MYEAYFLLLVSLIAGGILGLFLLRPFFTYIQTSAQMLYLVAVICCLFPAGIAFSYMTIGAPLLVALIDTYHEMIIRK